MNILLCLHVCSQCPLRKPGQNISCRIERRRSHSQRLKRLPLIRRARPSVAKVIDLVVYNGIFGAVAGPRRYRYVAAVLGIYGGCHIRAAVSLEPVVQPVRNGKGVGAGAIVRDDTVVEAVHFEEGKFAAVEFGVATCLEQRLGEGTVGIEGCGDACKSCDSAVHCWIASQEPCETSAVGNPSDVDARLVDAEVGC